MKLWVASISRDAITRDRGSERPSAVAGSDSATSEPKNQDLIYSARIALGQRSMKVEDRTVSQLPGMAANQRVT